MVVQDREGVARLLAKVMKSRYKSQAFERDDEEAWIRAALEGDPVVLFESAWEYWTKGSDNFRPTPGVLFHLAKTWNIDRSPYRTLSFALAAEAPDAGLSMLIQRFGAERFESAKAARLPSHEATWLEINLDHRRYAFAKKRMTERGAPPWNPSEAGTVTNSTMIALASPRSANEIPGLAFNAKIQGLLDNVQETTRHRTPKSLD